VILRRNELVPVISFVNIEELAVVLVRVVFAVLDGVASDFNRNTTAIIAAEFTSIALKRI
jgi:hypothetical protein